MSLFFDVNINNKIIPFGSKSEGINQNAVFNNTADDVYIALYPNNSNDWDFDNYNNNISFGASNLTNYYEGYISTKKNKLIRFNDYSIITNVDILPDNKESFGNNSNTFYSLTLSSNIYLNNTFITSSSSNIYIINDLLTDNINILDNIFSYFIISSNLLTSNLYTNTLYTSNIYNKSITSSNLILNKLLSYNSSFINNIITNTLYTNDIISSNIIIYNTLSSSNISTNNIISSYIYSSNVSNLYDITTNYINISSNSFLGNVIIDNDIIPSLNDSYNIGSTNYKFSNVYIYDNIISDYNILFTSYSNIIINNNFIVKNAYSININANNISAYNINTNGTNIFNNIINNNYIYTDIIITSNITSLDKIISKYITTNNINTNQLFTSNINILGLIYSKSIESDTIRSSNIYTSNFNTNQLTSLNLNISNTSFINTLLTYNDIILQKNNLYNLGSSNNTWNSLYISSNIFLDNASISSSSSSIILNNSLYTSNIYTSNINTDILYINNIYSSNSSIITSNIIANTINTNTINTSNIINYNRIKTPSLNVVNINNANNIFTSNFNIIYSIYANLFNASNIITNEIISSNIVCYDTLTTSNIYITDYSYINKLLIPTDLNPSYCNYYNLGSINKKWKDAYLTGNTIYIGDFVISVDNINSNSLDITNINNSNIYQSIILNGITFVNDSRSLYANININDGGVMSFISSNTNKGSLSYNNLKDIPLYSSCNFILNNITSSNSIFYNNLSINTLGNSLNTLNVNGKIISKYFIGSYIGDILNVSNILTKNLINNLIERNGEIILPNFTFNNNLLNINQNGQGNIYANTIQTSYYGNGLNISNIIASNIINTLPVYNSGFGCNNITKGYIIVGNNSNSVIISPNLTFNNINNTLDINGLLNTNNINISNLIISCNIFYGNASNINNIISSNIKGILTTDIGGVYYNIYSNLIWDSNKKTFNVSDNIFTTKNIYSYYIGNGLNISNIVSSNLIYNITINQGGINSNYYTFGTSNISWTNNKITVKNNINAKNAIASYFTGNGVKISNIDASFINSIVNISKGGLSNNIYTLNEILFYNSTSISSSPNLSLYNNILNVILNVKGKINANKISSSRFISSGENISNINAKNIIDVLSTNNGGTFNNIFPINNILFVDSNIYNSNIISSSSNLYWDNNKNKLNIKGSLYVNNIYSTYYGNAFNISNIISSNLNPNIITKVSSGGTGNNYINYGNLLIGNNTNSLLFNNNLNFSNNILYSKQIYSVKYSHTKVMSYKIHGGFIGSGENISNINSLIGSTSIYNGGTGLSNINIGYLPYTNIVWNNNKLQINSNINANTFYSYYNGNATNVSNIYSSNLINRLTNINGGFVNYINYYTISWNNSNYSLSINEGSMYVNKSYSLYYGSAINISNIISSNLINRLQNNNGSVGNLIFNNGINFSENNSLVSININKIYSKKIYNNIYYGDATNLSNINSIINVINVNNGGLNSNNIIKNFILYGDNNNISTSSNLYWNNNNNLFINNLQTNNIYGKYYGNANNISNFNASILKGQINQYNGSFSTNYINYYSNIIWNNNLKKLIINGNIYNNKTIANSFIGNGINISNINAKYIISKLSTINGGNNNISNITWSNDILNINNNIYAQKYYSKTIGNGNNISNIYSCNIIFNTLNINGGTSLSNLLINHILIGNGYTDNLLWSNNTLIVNNNISSKNIIGKFTGDATNISNILSSGINNLNIINGGLGCNNINLGNIIIGNNDNPIIISSNLYWNINNNSLITNNIVLNNITAKKYIGSANNLSNIYSSNIIDRLYVINGGLGCNTIPYSYIIIGNNSNSIITTNNLTFNSSNLYSINLSSYTLSNNNIYSYNSINSYTIQGRFIGNSTNISNINASNLINSFILYNNGGTNTNYIKLGNLLYQNYNSTEFLDNIYWDNINNILTINSNIISKNISSYFIGDGLNVSNIISSNIISYLSLANGGTYCNLIPLYNLLVGNNNSIITTNDLSFINKTLIVNGTINASNFYGNFIGSSFTGNNYTKLFSSNVIDNFSMSNGGLTSNYNNYGKIYFGGNNNITVSSNISWSVNKSLVINGNINILNSNNYLYSKYNSSNIINIININNGGLGSNYINNQYILYGNSNSLSSSCNLIWNYNKLSTTNIYSLRIFSKFYGNSYNISNINATKLYNNITLTNGGTGNTIFPYGNILLGNNSNIITTSSKLNWNNINNKLTILGDIIPSGGTIYSKFFGDGNNITNILLSNHNFLGEGAISHGGTGRDFFMSNQILIANDKYPILTSKKFVWDNINNVLNINGGLYSKNIYTNIVYNLVAENIIGVVNILNGGTGTSNIYTNYIAVGNDSNTLIQNKNFKWIKNINTLQIGGNIYSINNKGKFFGNGSLISNLLASNLYSNLQIINGGTGSNFFKINNILIGNNKDIIYNTNSLSFNNDFLYVNSLYNNSLTINNNIIGKGLNISNLNISKFYGVLKFTYGGSSYDTIPYGQLLIGDNYNIPKYSSNIIWSNVNNTLYVDEVYTINSIGKFNGNGENISNIIHSNIISQLNIINGGLSSNFINYGYIVHGNDNSIIASSNLYWNNSNNILNINGNVNVNNINIRNYVYTKSFQGLFKGDGINISNLQYSNFIHYTDVINGGTGYNYINNGQLLIGNNTNTLITTSNLKWNNIEGSLIVDRYDSGWIKANTLYTNKFYGDGQNISNYIFYASNMVPSDIISVLNGCMGSNFHNYNQLIFGDDLNPFKTSCNLYIDDIYKNNLNVKGVLNSYNVYASGGITGLSYQGKFYGDGIGLSNIYYSNITGGIPVVNYGTGYSNIIPKGQLLIGNNINTIITTCNLLYDIDNSILTVNGAINTTTTSFEGNANVSNSLCSNILSITNNSSYNYLYGNNISTASIIGDGINISNILVDNILDLKLSVINGGTGCNLLPLYQILTGNNNSINVNSNLMWIDNLLINGDLISYNISNNNITGSSFKSTSIYGDGNNISNYLVSSIIGTLPVSFGGTGSNYIDYCQLLIGNNSNTILTTSNLLWNENNAYLYINGNFIIITLSSTTISSSNLLTSNKLIINGNSYYNKIKTNIIQSKFIGNGSSLNNINVKNMSAISLPSYYGGTGSNSLNKGLLLLGNNDNPLLTTSNLSWDNYNFNVNGDIYLKNYYTYINSLSSISTKTTKASSLYGDGYNISNLGVNNIAGVIDVKFGGTGKSNITLGHILVGNNSNTILTTSNFNWNDENTILNISNILNSITIFSTSIDTSNVSVNNNLIVDNYSYYNKIYSKSIQSSFYGNGLELSNIVVNNIKDLNLKVINGGFGSNNLDIGGIVIGNNDNPVIISSNLNWNNNILNVNGLLNTSNINTLLINTNTLVSSLFIGDGISLSNININNVNNILLKVSNGGTGHSNIDSGCILVGNNTNPLIFTSNLLWNDSEQFLNATKINTNAISIDISLYSSNIICSNIINTGSNIFNNIYCKTIQSKFYGNGINLSNLNIQEFKGSLSYLNGGTSSNNLLNGAILLGNGNINGVLTSSKLLWNNNLNSFDINGNIFAYNSLYNNLSSKSIYTSRSMCGDGANISNIVTNNIIGTFPVSASGTGCNILIKDYLLIGNNNNPIILSSNLYWDDNTSTLNILGRFYTSTSVSSVSIETSNFNATNLSAVSTIYKNSFSNIYVKKIQGFFIGDANNVSNVSINNITGTVFLQNGGLSCNIINNKCIIIGNGNNSISTTSKLIWDYDNNVLNINGDLNINNFNAYNIYNLTSIISKTNYASYLAGDGNNLSNLYTNNFIGTFPVSCSGTGCNFISYGQLLIGNIANAIITTSNLIWDNNNDSLNINGLLYANTLSFTSLTTSNVITSNLNIDTSTTSTFNSIDSLYIQSKFIGDAKNITNISVNNIIDNIKVINGGSSSNSFIYGNILYGNGNNIIDTSNITFNNNILNINGNISANNIANTYIYSPNLYNSYMIGDGTNITNINRNNIIGTYNVINGGTGNNVLENTRLLIGNGIGPISTSSNLYWSNNTLFVDSTIYLSSIMSVSEYNAYDSITCNLTVSLDSTFNNLYSEYIQSSYYGDGYELSNININNIDMIPRSINSNTLTYGNIIVGNSSNNVIVSSNLSWYDNKLYSTNITSSNLNILYYNQSNINATNIYVNNYIIDKAFYISLQISTSSTIGNFIPFNINNTLSSLNISSYWNTNYFIPPTNGLYSFDYSICCDMPCVIWINKGNDFSNNYNYRFGNKYIANNGSININLDCKITDNIYFAIHSISGTGNILVNDTIGNTKASITLLQKY